MTVSKTIAGLIGPSLVAAAVAMLLNLRSLPTLIGSVSNDPALIFVSGMLLFIGGLAIVRAHNVWAGWAVLVTVLGWVGLLSGLARMLFPIQLAAMAVAFSENTGLIVVIALVLLALGVFLSFKAYGRG
jgi:hypothetical protein